ncbi:FadR/GntR family transcriptional regulator [Sphingomonas asaccharolytica]|uniref:FadR/GntR family transcriptional regulator n=1 Tax=Sphingomonas asaccharolytica TaxID=40681 RepID=UPI000830E2FD|nr:GntR family transcriptional regulator [Sphingomonas asaccharolytica]
MVDLAVRHVRDHIRENDLKVGDTLPGEGAFAEQLGVSRAVMHEAFSTLAALHQIDVGNGRKARVAAIDGSALSTSLDHAVATAQVTVNEIWDVRRTLELRTASSPRSGEATRKRARSSVMPRRWRRMAAISTS